MDLLISTTRTTSPGSTTVSFPVGVSAFTIIAVKRAGIQHDKVLNADINNGGTRQWAIAPFHKIKFPNAFPFETGEKVFIMYKVTI